jgi:dienelactone hydrolase
MRVSRRRAVLISVALALALLAAGIVAAREYVNGAAFVVQAAGMHGIVRTLAEWDSEGVAEQPLRIPWRDGELSGRLYTPQKRTGRPILLVPGVHAAGIAEPRLITFARDLASMGHPVVTVQLDDLMGYRITVRTTDMIEDAATWLLSPAAPVHEKAIGMIGISFGGGLTIVAAGRQSIRERLAFAMSLGGHGDLPRTLRYLCTGMQTDGAYRAPHDYGVAIILLDVADQVVPAPQVEPLRAAILSYLEASRLDMVDKAQATREFEKARALAEGLPEPARTLMAYVNTRDVKHLGPILLPHVTRMGGDPALSPSRSTPPVCPVYLLHGTDDNVIPAIESALLARDLRGRGLTVHELETPLITHAEVDRSAKAPAMFRLVKFWGSLLDE